MFASDFRLVHRYLVGTRCVPGNKPGKGYKPIGSGGSARIGIKTATVLASFDAGVVEFVCFPLMWGEWRAFSAQESSCDSLTSAASR